MLDSRYGEEFSYKNVDQHQTEPKAFATSRIFTNRWRLVTIFSIFQIAALVVMSYFIAEQHVWQAGHDEGVPITKQFELTEGCPIIAGQPVSIKPDGTVRRGAGTSIYGGSSYTYFDDNIQQFSVIPLRGVLALPFVTSTGQGKLALAKDISPSSDTFTIEWINVQDFPILAQDSTPLTEDGAVVVGHGVAAILQVDSSASVTVTNSTVFSTCDSVSAKVEALAPFVVAISSRCSSGDGISMQTLIGSIPIDPWKSFVTYTSQQLIFSSTLPYYQAGTVAHSLAPLSYDMNEQTGSYLLAYAVSAASGPHQVETPPSHLSLQVGFGSNLYISTETHHRPSLVLGERVEFTQLPVVHDISCAQLAPLRAVCAFYDPGLSEGVRIVSVAVDKSRLRPNLVSTEALNAISNSLGSLDSLAMLKVLPFPAFAGSFNYFAASQLLNTPSTESAEAKADGAHQLDEATAEASGAIPADSDKRRLLSRQLEDNEVVGSSTSSDEIGSEFVVLPGSSHDGTNFAVVFSDATHPGSRMIQFGSVTLSGNVIPTSARFVLAHRAASVAQMAASWFDVVTLSGSRIAHVEIDSVSTLQNRRLRAHSAHHTLLRRARKLAKASFGNVTLIERAGPPLGLALHSGACGKQLQVALHGTFASTPATTSLLDVVARSSGQEKSASHLRTFEPAKRYFADTRGHLIAGGATPWPLSWSSTNYYAYLAAGGVSSTFVSFDSYVGLAISQSELLVEPLH